MGTNLKTEEYIIITKPLMSPKNYGARHENFPACQSAIKL